MKKIIAGIVLAAALGIPLAAPALAGPAMCGGHQDMADMPNGYGKDSKYVTACGGDSGPDAAGNNATAPKVDTSVTG